VLAEVLTSAASWQDERPLLTYLVPGELQAQLRPGQLVAIPYGERLVEGIVWNVRQDGKPENDYTLRPIHTILDFDPVLWPHQRQLAEWIAQYYITPLAQVALMMLPPGLMQRSKIVLRLVSLPSPVTGNPTESHAGTIPQHAEANLTTRALLGLLLADGELDVERLKEMLGPKRAKEVLREATASGLIEREARLHPPQAHARHKRVVRLIAHGEALEAWRQRMETQLRESLVEAPAASMAPDNVRRRPKKSLPDPWAIPGVADALTLKPKSRAGLLAQRQLAAVDLLQHNRSERLSEGSLQFFDQPYWTPGMLCKASSLTPAQLQALARDNIIAIEEIEIRRDPLLGRTIPASSPLPLTPDQQAALEEILVGVPDEMPIQASSRQGPPTSTQPPRATTSGKTIPPLDDGAPGTRAGGEASRNVVARGGGVDAGGPCVCQ
jgi:primosomal protein N' (replication factor Y) (superfamily II helicase)